MNRKLITLFSLIFFFSSGCFTSSKMTIKDLRPSGELSDKLPALETKVSITNLENAYTKGSTKSRGVGLTGTSNGLLYPGVVSTTIFGSNTIIFADPRVNDFITLYEREIKDNITDPFGKKHGYTISRISFIESKVNKWNGRQKATIEVELEIFNMEGNLVGRYHGDGYGESKISEWSLHNVGNLRKANEIALKIAFSKIKEQIEVDDRVRKLLKQ